MLILVVINIAGFVRPQVDVKLTNECFPPSMVCAQMQGY